VPHSLRRWWLVGLLLLVACGRPKGPAPVLLPGTAEPIQRLFTALQPALRYDSIQIDRDHVLARLCAEEKSGPCFSVRLEPAAECATTVAGPFCVLYPEGAPSRGHQELVERTLHTADGQAMWSTVPKAETQYFSARGLLLALLVLGTLLGGFAESLFRKGLVGRALEWVAALILGGVAFVWMQHVNGGGGTPIVFLYVVDCLLFDQCFTIGPGSSVILNNGGVWPEILLGIRHFGGSPEVVSLTVNALLASGVGLVFLVVSRFLKPSLATPTAVLALALLAPLSLGSPLIDCSVTFLFCAGTEAALLIFALTGRSTALVVGSVFLAHAVGAHTSAVSLLPAFLFLTQMSDTPLRSAVLALAAFMITSLITSSDAVIANVKIFERPQLLPWALLGLALVIGVATWLRPRFQQLRPGTRAVLAGICFLLPHAGGVVTLLLIHHDILPRYLPPVVAPLAALVVFALAAPLGRRRLAFVLPLAVALFALHQHPWPEGPLAATTEERRP
jgi:hypothetical protein